MATCLFGYSPGARLGFYHPNHLTDMTTEQLLINCYRLLVLDDKSVKRSFVLHELRREVEERIGKDATEELANEV